MDSQNGGQTSTNQPRPLNSAGRQTAASIARRKVLAAYGNAAQTAAKLSDSQNTANNTSDSSEGPVVEPIRSVTGWSKDNADLPLKDQPIQTKPNPESWKKYHSAWQDYYQKYYSEYYSRAARTYVAKERLKDARKKAEEGELSQDLSRLSGRSRKSNRKIDQKAAPGTIASADSEPDVDDVKERLRQTIRKKAVKDVKKSRRHRRFIPILAGIAVVLLILFIQYNRLIFAPIYAYVSPGNAPASEIEAIDPTLSGEVSPDPRLIIPKLNVDVPVYFGLQLTDVMSAMNSGVAHYRVPGASAYPGEIGNTVITGHSAGDIYSSNPYKYIFSGLERMEDGDLIYVNYNSVRYTYRVTKREVVEPSNVAALVVETDKPLLTLVTCTPLGTSRYRLLLTAEQISPNVETATASDDSDVAAEQSDNGAMPSNEPSFFEKIWNFLTGK